MITTYYIKGHKKKQIKNVSDNNSKTKISDNNKKNVWIAYRCIHYVFEDAVMHNIGFIEKKNVYIQNRKNLRETHVVTSLKF